MSFSMIAAIGKNRELGKNGGLIWNLPGDLEYFKKTTMGHPILMGHRTFSSLPGVLPGRKHYVISRETPSTALENSSQVEFVNDLEKFVAEHEDDPEEIFVIGGGMVYWEMMKHCNKLYLTEIDAEDAAADTFLPEFSHAEYEKTEVGKGEDNGVSYTFSLYTKK